MGAPKTLIMLKTVRGSPDGVASHQYQQRETYVFRTVSELDLAGVFLDQGWANPAPAATVVETKPLPSVEAKPLPRAEPVQKIASPVATKARRRGRPSKSQK